MKAGTVETDRGNTSRKEEKKGKGGNRRKGRREKERESEEEKGPEEERNLHLDISHNVFFSLKVSKYSPPHHGFATANLLQIKTHKVSQIWTHDNISREASFLALRHKYYVRFKYGWESERSVTVVLLNSFLWDIL